MKKIFLTAFVVIVAVGGAFAEDYYLIESDQIVISCKPGQYTCNIKYGFDVFVSPTPAPNQPIQVQVSIIPWGPE